MNSKSHYCGQAEHVRLLYSEKKIKQDRNIEYLLELKTENLLFSFYTEAGLNGYLNRHLDQMNIHDGWDNPVCQIRGTFTGHWLSAAARLYQQTGNAELKAKADYIVSEINRCQEYNGNGWAFPIPEKYLYGLKEGKHFWAPQYVCHKIMMGLLDMYQFAESKQALEILKGCAQWFTDFNRDISRRTMDMMMDLEETGGIMELWGDLYEITKDPAHLELMYKYERPRLTAPLLEGRDVLTNMHANATIPEIHGCAKAYEVTGEDRLLNIVKNYWELAVDRRGMFATGGQTDGEVWTPIQKQAAHLSHLNQEHCTVYNMIRLADYLFRFTGEAKYLDYIERNIENGLMAQGFWEAQHQDNAMEKPEPSSGLISYFLPLAAGSKKKWGSKTKDFWCCHCTLVQANAKYREYIFYRSEDEVIVAQYIPAELTATFRGQKVQICQTQADLTGECVKINDTSCAFDEKPSFLQMRYDINADSPISFRLKIRIPWWIQGKMAVWINGEPAEYSTESGYAVLDRQWHRDFVEVRIPKAITCWPLADEKNTVAFMDGPVVLAGLVSEERTLTGDISHPETMIRPHHIRQWADWTSLYKTVGQMRGFYLKPLKDIGDQEYTVYFPISQK
ncbi:MAG: glycoside hydrolase family 127 protein [Lachnospiraceae bacterium]|nr:glycoside hydrolase family 127 protein [Lachnospiraceae bacterium]